MAGPIIEAIREVVNDSENVGRDLENSPLLSSHREQIEEEMDSAGGCCSAATVARAVRQRGREYR